MTNVTFRTPSLDRYFKLFWNTEKKSILRCLEYEKLLSLSLEGKILDFGGGNKSNYINEMSTWGERYEYQSINIDNNIEPTYLIDKKGKFPIEDQYFDAVLSLNTLEHVIDLDNSLNEIKRVLKSNGKFIFIVPFIFRVHGHPSDYLRGTPSFWQKKLQELDFDCKKIQALSWGPFSTASTISGTPGPFKTLRQHLALFLDMLYMKCKYGSDILIEQVQDVTPVCSPIAYYIEACKLK